jgi:hypothetical protein
MGGLTLRGDTLLRMREMEDCLQVQCLGRRRGDAGDDNSACSAGFLCSRDGIKLRSALPVHTGPRLDLLLNEAPELRVLDSVMLAHDWEFG